MPVGVNPPKTPVTEGSQGVAAATVPNVCKMPGPPAPFVPTPLPNIAKSGDSLDGATKDVKIEGKGIAIKGATFKSMGDVASKGTGGGLVSATTHDKAKFVAPGSMDVKAEGQNIQLMSDATSNNNSNPANSATVMLLQNATTLAQIEAALEKIAEECNDAVNEEEGYTKANPPQGKVCTTLGTKKHTCCENAINDANNPKVKSEVGYGPRGGVLNQGAVARARAAADTAYQAGGSWIGAFMSAGGGGALRADVVVLRSAAGGLGRANISRVFDFKFNCGDEGKMDQDQLNNYQNALGQTPTIIHASW